MVSTAKAGSCTVCDFNSTMARDVYICLHLLLLVPPRTCCLVQCLLKATAKQPLIFSEAVILLLIGVVLNHILMWAHSHWYQSPPPPSPASPFAESRENLVFLGNTKGSFLNQGSDWEHRTYLIENLIKGQFFLPTATYCTVSLGEIGGSPQCSYSMEGRMAQSLSGTEKSI